MRFPTRLLAAHLAFGALLWAGYVVVIALFTVAVAIIGKVTGSIWELAAQLPRIYVLFFGVSLVREYLPMYVAHGQTRRRFAEHAAATIAVFAPCMAALMAVGYLIENGYHALAGWPQGLERPHLFESTGQAGLVFSEYLIEFLAWATAGALIGAGFYRWRGGGLLLTLPAGIALVLVAAGATGSELRMPFVAKLLAFRVDLPDSLPVTYAVGLGVFLAGLALTWPIIRDVPLRNR
ncbi:hypothetical protein Aph01nite_50380 [Acrocarpospora phusangensis]|uniref:Uncharacterized protein n=1 Tax=Acrocarpospora phusangensis TaxID=1070424 RepID=A0A919QFS5_9ACTN|nr:hypothetical protein [Acrocarpospora phusangensis]GIH26728.1 hypothetical protein Aph01nite_50380 [Acrocarpospora phusangensis]